MPNPQFDVERATAGLVMALFVASALLLAGLLYFVSRDLGARRTDADTTSARAPTVQVVSSPSPASST